METLLLDVVEFTDDAHWRWRLTEKHGVILAEHRIDLDRRATEYEGFVDLDHYLRWRVSPDRRAEEEAGSVAQVGRWIGRHVFGDVGRAIVARAATEPVVVRVRVPYVACQLFVRPFELADVNGRPLARDGVSLVLEPTDQPSGQVMWTAGVGERIRMLAVFSLPTDERALALRRERHELARLVRHIAEANHAAIELRVVQYGATRERLKEILADPEGWDVLHISGHGLPGGLLLEHADGRPDLIGTRQLAQLLTLAADRLKLVTLSSCASAAAVATASLRRLGLNSPSRSGQSDPSLEDFVGTGLEDRVADDGPATAASDRLRDALAPDLRVGRLGSADGELGGGPHPIPLPTLGSELARHLDCGVLAMRYPVDDEFAIGLTRRLYECLLGKGWTLPRSLQLALAEAAVGAPPLSIAAPALFGRRAAELTLLPPKGALNVIDIESDRLAGFPSQPVRFVGRVGPMARASAALARESGKTGVLLYGMAGSGKTACALELAYTHEQRFDRLVFHKAPAEGGDVVLALANLALDLQHRLPGLEFAHLVHDRTALMGFLPSLTRYLERTATLIVIDSLESLLTEQGKWHDERWKIVIAAVAGHSGPSRMILAAQRRPKDLDTRVLIEPIHALSPTEAMLLARELPNLRALLDDTTGSESDRSRTLVSRTLAIVQGHPKLIELADGQATDPKALEARLTDADQAWLEGGTQLAAFFEQGESAASDEDYLRVRTSWTHAIAKTLPKATATLFAFLCALEENDRLPAVVESTWANLWRRLARSGDPPTLETALADLAAHGLVAVETLWDRPTAYRLHPGVAQAGRTGTEPGFQPAVDAELAVYWVDILQSALAREAEQQGGLLLRAGRNAVPYLLRLNDWPRAGKILEHVLDRDSSPGTVAALLPALQRIAQATAGTEQELEHRRLLARALLLVQPAQTTAQLRGLLNELFTKAVAQQRFRLASELLGDLSDLAARAGRLDEALAIVRLKRMYTRKAGLGRWTQLADEGRRLGIRARQGRSEEVFQAVQALEAEMSTLPQASEAEEAVVAWRVREDILGVGVTVAGDLKRWGRALAWSTRQVESMRRRGAPALEVARIEFDEYWVLVRMRLLDEAKELLLACRTVFEDAHDHRMLGDALSALSDLEEEFGHRDNAIQLEHDALRYKYINENAIAIAVSHHNLANYLERAADDPPAAFAHRLASAMIEFQIDSGRLSSTAEALGRQLLRFDDTPSMLLSFTELCSLVDRVEGVHLGRLIENLPKRAPTGQAALAEVVRLAREVPPDDLTADVRGIAAIVSALATMVGADKNATEPIRESLAARGEITDWKPLIDRLGRILIAGERGDDLVAGLDPADAAIVQALCSVLTGEVLADPESLQAGATAIMNVPGLLPEGHKQILETMVDDLEVPGEREIPDALAALRPVLGEIAEDEDTDLGTLLVLARDALARKHGAGERGVALPELTEGLGSTDATVEGILDWFGTLADEGEARQIAKQFAPLIEAIVAAAQGDQALMAALEPFLADADADWDPLLTAALRRILAGERGAALTRGLGSVEGSIVDAILDKL